MANSKVKAAGERVLVWGNEGSSYTTVCKHKAGTGGAKEKDCFNSGRMRGCERGARSFKSWPRIQISSKQSGRGQRLEVPGEHGSKQMEGLPNTIPNTEGALSMHEARSTSQDPLLADGFGVVRPSTFISQPGPRSFHASFFTDQNHSQKGTKWLKHYCKLIALRGHPHIQPVDAPTFGFSPKQDVGCWASVIALIALSSSQKTGKFGQRTPEDTNTAVGLPIARKGYCCFGALPHDGSSGCLAFISGRPQVLFGCASSVELSIGVERVERVEPSTA